MQTTSHILMISPSRFAFNAETAVNNAFQVKGDDTQVQENARREFEGFVHLLRQNGVDVTVVNDTPDPHTPDSIFPNNWVSFHHDGTMLLYPMFAVNRRSERKSHVIDQISKRFSIEKRIDLSPYESENLFLEGTGSMVLDREHRIAYACLSPRTDMAVLDAFCSEMNYTAVTFHAFDGNRKPIYHTNVMMCVADAYVVICLETIADPEERQTVTNAIVSTGKKIIAITIDQVNRFAGNMLQVENVQGEKLLVMSSQAYESLTVDQIAELTRYNRIIHAPILTIETNGGGSARCMMAEVHLPLR